MKNFNIPEVSFIQMNEDDVIVTSGCVGTYTCRGYICNDCVECEGSYTCLIYDVKK